MKTFWMLIYCIVFSCLSVQAQTDRQEFRNYFYDQRRSFFEAMPDTPNEVIMLGNSITNGASWDELFPSVNIKNRGISSDITLGVLDRIDEVVSSKPLKVFILIGVNDIARGIGMDTIVSNYTGIIESIQQKSPQTEVYVQSVLPTNDEFDTFKGHQGKTEQILLLNKHLKQLATDHNVTFIDLYSHFIDSNGKMDKRYTNDGLHLVGEGYLNWTNLLKNHIN